MTSTHTPYIAGQNIPRGTIHLACEHCKFTLLVKADKALFEALHPTKAFGPERKAFLAGYEHATVVGL